VGECIVTRAAAYFQAGHLEEALATAEQSRRIVNIYQEHFLKVLCLARLERWQEATDALQQLRKSWPEMTISFAETYVRRERFFGREQKVIAANAAIVRRLWNETGGRDS
jgi:hypothetical protein